MTLMPSVLTEMDTSSGGHRPCVRHTGKKQITTSMDVYALYRSSWPYEKQSHLENSFPPDTLTLSCFITVTLVQVMKPCMFLSILSELQGLEEDAGESKMSDPQ